MVVATGHFAAYTYITALVRRDAGLSGLGLSAVLFGYGAAGIGGIVLAGRITDRWPRRSTAACVAGLVVALAALATVAHGSTAGTVAAVVVWGAGFTALPVALQAAVLRVAPRSADTASALYVVAFQIGIGGGALAGSLLVNAGLLARPAAGRPGHGRGRPADPADRPPRLPGPGPGRPRGLPRPRSCRQPLKADSPDSSRAKAAAVSA